MNAEPGRRLAAERKYPGIGDQHRIRPRFGQIPNIFPQSGKIAVASEDIDGDIHLFAARVSKGDAFGQLVIGKIIGKGAQRKIFAAHIYGVCPEVQGAPQFC